MTSKSTALALGGHDGEPPGSEARKPNTRFAIVLPKLAPAEAESVAEWPVQIRFPTVGDAMRLLASAKTGTEGPGSTLPMYMSVAEYAQHRRLSKRSVETLIKRGLPLDGRGRLRRVPVAEADRWMAEQNDGGVTRRAQQAARRAARVCAESASGSEGES